jgi:hypothetical protein
MDEQKFVDFMETIKTLMAIRPRGEVDIALSYYNAGPPPFLPENLLEVKNSDIHGKGVFAKNNIDANQVVSLYPCHGIIKKNVKYYCEEKNSGEYGDLLFNSRDYMIPLKRTDRVFIYGNPYIQDEGSLGHLINDSYKNVSDLKHLNKHNMKLSLKYMLDSVKSNNCTLVQSNDYVYVKTTKYINKGEELLTNYGFPYWCSELKFNEVELLFTEYIRSHSESQKEYIKSLCNQLHHTCPAPSPYIVNALQKAGFPIWLLFPL